MGPCPSTSFTVYEVNGIPWICAPQGTWSLGALTVDGHKGLQGGKAWMQLRGLRAVFGMWEQSCSVKTKPD